MYMSIYICYWWNVWKHGKLKSISRRWTNTNWQTIKSNEYKKSIWNALHDELHWALPHILPARPQTLVCQCGSHRSSVETLLGICILSKYTTHGSRSTLPWSRLRTASLGTSTLGRISPRQLPIESRYPQRIWRIHHCCTFLCSTLRRWTSNFKCETRIIAMLKIVIRIAYTFQLQTTAFWYPTTGKFTSPSNTRQFDQEVARTTLLHVHGPDGIKSNMCWQWTHQRMMLNRLKIWGVSIDYSILNCNESFITTTKKEKIACLCLSQLLTTKGELAVLPYHFALGFATKKHHRRAWNETGAGDSRRSFLNFSRFDRRHSKCNLESMENAVTWNLHHQVAKQNGTSDVCIIPNKNKCLAAQPSHMQAQCVLQSNVQFCC